ncbi:MAG: DUF938 domain-containing protein [Novosphingobium sp.]|nr:DUF938 domain-containing protein [Novosphingobium sp.]
MPGNTDDRRHAPATERNRDPIVSVLQGILPESGLALEIASGTGEHAIHFARVFPGLTWQPSDPSADARQSISAWIAAEGLSNMREPLDLDAASEDWPIAKASAILCINMIHISPWEATEGLMRGAGQLLETGSPLYLYGPYRRADRPLEPSNEAFDRDLRSRDSRWGLRDVEKVAECASRQRLRLVNTVDMPANNLSLVFRKE